jgi:molecular chaperone Hsp33
MITPQHIQVGQLLPFMFDNIPVRGKVLRLDDLNLHIPALQGKPENFVQMLCDLVSTAVLFSHDLKNANRVTLQIQSEGEVPLLVAQCIAGNTLKAYGKTKSDITGKRFIDLFNNNAILALSVDMPHAQQPYQSFVALNHQSLTSSLEQYFSQSAQVKTYLRVFSGVHHGKTACAALFLQALPGENLSEDDWHRLGLILNTLTLAEALPGTLTDLDLLRRLFIEDELRLFAAQPLTFNPHHNREKMLDALKSLGLDACLGLLQEGKITMTDEFSGFSESFTEADIRALFATPEHTS